AAEKKRRLNMIEQLQESIVTEINARLLGNTVEVLVEGQQKGKWQGRTRTDKLVFFTDNGDHTGRLVNIRIEKTSPWSLQGRLEINGME
ncbi:TRAM domain-containing protein, partial [Chloroflexota bacterium]